MDTSRIVSGALLVVCTAAAACSGSTSGADLSSTAPSETTDAGATDSATAADSSTPAEPPKKDASVAPPPAGECSSSATQTACVSCCSKAHEDGAGAYLVATIDCMCLPANCATECAATLCNAENPKNPDTKCSTCLQAKNGACAQSIKNACTADPECVAFDACIGKSDCTGKTN